MHIKTFPFKSCFKVEWAIWNRRVTEKKIVWQKERESKLHILISFLSWVLCRLDIIKRNVESRIIKQVVNSTQNSEETSTLLQDATKTSSPFSSHEPIKTYVAHPNRRVPAFSAATSSCFIAFPLLLLCEFKDHEHIVRNEMNSR